MPVYKELEAEFKAGKGKIDRGECSPADAIGIMFKGYALDAVDAARDNFSVNLDFSGDSVKNVEIILDKLAKLRTKDKPPEDAVMQYAKMYAGYIAEVIKRQWGGSWIDD